MTVHLGKGKIGATSGGTPTLFFDVIDDTTGATLGVVQCGTYHAATVTPPPPPPPPAPGGEVMMPGTYTTAYDFQDNNPPNSAAISNPVIHHIADGTGTYADPITVAVDHLADGSLQFPKGTIFYVPNIRRYLIVEDTTGELAPAVTHLDMWAGGDTSTQASAFDCMSHVTGHVLVIRNPASNYAVLPGPLAANNACTALFGDVIVPAGTTPPPPPPPPPPPTSTLPSPIGPVAPVLPPTNLPKPTSSYSGGKMTVDQCLKYGWDAGFHTPTDLQILCAISMAESSMDSGGCRNWHPEYGVRPTSDVMLVFPPGGARLHADRGPWQISSHFYPQYTDSQCDTPAVAAQVVKLIKDNRGGWSQWNTFTNGAYKTLGPSLAVVNAFIAGPH